MGNSFRQLSAFLSCLYWKVRFGALLCSYYFIVTCKAVNILKSITIDALSHFRDMQDGKKSVLILLYFIKQESLAYMSFITGLQC